MLFVNGGCVCPCRCLCGSRQSPCIFMILCEEPGPGRGPGVSPRRISSRVAEQRCAGTRIEVRESESAFALFFFSSAWAHRDSCILAGRVALLGRSPGLCPELLQTVHGSASGACLAWGSQYHRCPCRQLSMPQAHVLQPCLSSVQKPRACMPSVENSGVPILCFWGVGEQVDPRGHAGNAGLGGGHRVFTEQPWQSRHAPACLRALVQGENCPS